MAEGEVPVRVLGSGEERAGLAEVAANQGGGGAHQDLRARLELPDPGVGGGPSPVKTGPARGEASPGVER